VNKNYEVINELVPKTQELHRAIFDKGYEQGQRDVLDNIRAEIEGMYRVILKGTSEDDWAVRWNDCIDEVLQIIDKYRVEREE
jgi:hypothetical protein